MDSATVKLNKKSIFKKALQKIHAEKLKVFKYDDLVKYMYCPTDPSSLGVIRFLFGMLMLMDIIEERGGSSIDLRWGNPKDCHFPLFSVFRPLPYQYMTLLYGIMWIGAFGIMVGFKIKLFVILFGLPYWYLLFLDTSYWNNHSYLYGVVTILLLGSSATNFMSVDSLLDKSIKNMSVPYWNYFILKFQFFMLYFLAGLKKTDFEWLEGYSMTNLGSHWVFMPFQSFFTGEQIDFFIVHWFGFILDLTIGFWMLLDKTRPIAMLFCASFHLMNSRLFSIGMFPYVCLATMPLFCKEDWPKKLFLRIFKIDHKLPKHETCNKIKRQYTKKITWKNRFVIALLLSHCSIQTFLPYSHFITKGYNNWTNGLYGYSWDMMVHSWNTILVVVKVVDNNTENEYFIDSHAWTQNDRWNKHADMCLQYAQCLKKNLIQDYLNNNPLSIPANEEPQFITSENISIYIDVWCSMNGRFQQRMYNPNYDLLKANWSPIKPVPWLLPLLSKFNGFRKRLKEISEEVYSWSNQTEVLFIADFPGMYLENFIGQDVTNVSLTILEGEVIFEVEDKKSMQSRGVKLYKGDIISIQVGFFHKIHTTGSNHSCYMYIYTKEQENPSNMFKVQPNMYSPFPVIKDVENHLNALINMFQQILNSILHLLFNRPLNLRKKGI